MGEYDPNYSHWKGNKSLGDWINENYIIGISSVDTREIVKIIRENKDDIKDLFLCVNTIGIRTNTTRL